MDSFTIFARGGADDAASAPRMLSDDDNDCIAAEDFGAFGHALLLLFEGGISGDGYFECLRGAARPEQAVVGTAVGYVFFVVMGVLQVNLLIAMMAKVRQLVSPPQSPPRPLPATTPACLPC